MRTNIGNFDRVLRVMIGVLLLALFVGFRAWWGLLGIIPLATAAVGFCPLYGLFGWSSRRAEGHVRLM